MSTPIVNSRRYLSKLTFSPLRVHKDDDTLAGTPLVRLTLFTSAASSWTDDDVQKALDSGPATTVATFLTKYRAVTQLRDTERERMRQLRLLFAGAGNDVLTGTLLLLSPVLRARIDTLLQEIKPFEVRLLAATYPLEIHGLKSQIDARRVKIAALEQAIARAQQAARQIADDTPIEPLGLLFLERLTLTPSALERGELVYSLPLAPKEKVTLSHKEWRVREEEFAQSVHDSLDRYSERGVTAATELSVSTNEVASRADAVRASNTRRSGNTSRDGAANVTTTERVDAHEVENVTQYQASRDISVQESRTATELASSRSIQEHRVSFTVSTVAGSVDFTARLLENPSPDHTLRIDYWRRMLRWQVTLERVDVRLTYAVVIPDPGFELRQPHLELQRIDSALSQGFVFDLKAGAIDAAAAPALAATYNVTLPAPPPSALGPWQTQVWEICRAAAWARFAAAQEAQRARRDVLIKGLANTDVFRLRRLEQEQLSRQVVKWLFPRWSHEGYKHDGQAMPNSVQWGDVLEHGDYISFVHQALDWDNMLVSLYPYFWDAGAASEGKLLFDHPDPVHREFLRAGAAKVALPIRPGFEHNVLSLLESGEMGQLETGHVFRTVVDHVQAEHKDRLAAPDKIGEWEQCTPTGALDLDAVLRKVVVE